MGKDYRAGNRANKIISAGQVSSGREEIGGQGDMVCRGGGKHIFGLLAAGPIGINHKPSHYISCTGLKYHIFSSTLCSPL
jgi:hypothetical protein